MSQSASTTKHARGGASVIGLAIEQVVHFVDQGCAHRLILYDDKPCWIMGVALGSGELGLLQTKARQNRPSHPRELHAIKAIRMVHQQFREVPTRVVLPFVPDREFPYDDERRARLEQMIYG